MKKECHVCPECGGDGVIVGYACCGHFIAPFIRCNNPELEPVQCEYCGGTGQVEVEVIRHTGYYWCRIAGSWVIAYYDNDYGKWKLNSGFSFPEESFEIIEDRLIIHGEVEALEEKIRDIRANN